MKKLSSIFAIALFLSIPLVANADPVGPVYMGISWDPSSALSGVPYYTLYYGTISGTTVGIFCISDQTALSGTFELNTITSGGSYFDGHGQKVTISSALLSEAAWVANNWQQYDSSKYGREMAQLAIWAILGVTNSTFGYSEATTLVGLAGAYSDYAPSNWYAAFDSQDYLVPVPEPGILILLGIAMSAIGAASWWLGKH